MEVAEQGPPDAHLERPAWRRSVRYAGDCVEVVDQTRLPSSWVNVSLRSSDDVVDAIARLVVRGAPAIGACGAFGLALAISSGEVDPTSPSAHFAGSLRSVADRLSAARPTAVNLSRAVERVFEAALAAPVGRRAAAALEAATAVADEDAFACDAMAQLGADRVGPARRVLTHCNTGRLATCGAGTALGVVYELSARGHLDEVLVDETRPLLQGARLSATELVEAGIAVRVIVDGAAAAAMALAMVDAVLVGADRIACNGDTANKIGTYGLALSAAAHHVPFYVVAPTSTLDGSISRGSDIVIEERPGDEVLSWRGEEIAGSGARAWNPAFDVTPGHLITAIITEAGVVEPPFEVGLREIAAHLSGRAAGARAGA